jgi:hypothetical protein
MNSSKEHKTALFVFIQKGRQLMENMFYHLKKERLLVLMPFYQRHLNMIVQEDALKACVLFISILFILYSVVGPQLESFIIQNCQYLSQMTSFGKTIGNQIKIKKRNGKLSQELSEK